MEFVRGVVAKQDVNWHEELQCMYLFYFLFSPHFPSCTSNSKLSPRKHPDLRSSARIPSILPHGSMSSEFYPRSFATPARSHFYSHTLITNALRLLWVVVVISGELGAFFWSLSGCRWPSIDLGHVNHSSFHAPRIPSQTTPPSESSAEGQKYTCPPRRGPTGPGCSVARGKKQMEQSGTTRLV